MRALFNTNSRPLNVINARNGKIVNVDEFFISKTCRVWRAAVGLERSPPEKAGPSGGCIILSFFLQALASVLLFHLAAAFFTHFSSVSLSPVR